MKAVNWSSYARDYDLILAANPAYGELIAHCVSTVASWPLSSGDMVADIGGGTGNFSIALAHALPSVRVIHADFNGAMLEIARSKANASKLGNWRAVLLDVAQEDWNLPSLGGIVTVHSLYAFPNPKRVISKMAAQLKPGGLVYACDLGRVMKVLDWTLYLFKESVRARGFIKTATLFLRGQEVRRQNQSVARGQRRGDYWTHSLAEFKTSFEVAGIEVLLASNTFYRGYDDLVVGQKPKRTNLEVK